MSIFEMALESADMGEENYAPLANGEETHTVANEIAEVQGLAQEAADEEAIAVQMDEGAEQVEELEESLEEDVASESALDPTAAKFLTISLKNIVGARMANKKLPNQESFTGTRHAGREATRLALEGVRDTLKSIWAAIKAQFKKVFAKVKSWFIKVFSSAKKLAERAKKLRDKSDSTVGTIEDKTFSFSQTKAIAVAGKYKAEDVIVGLGNLTKAVDKGIDLFKKEVVDKEAEEFVKDIKEMFGASGKKTEKQKKAAKKLRDIVDNYTDTLSTNKKLPDTSDGYKKMFGDDKEVDLESVNDLPGSRAIIIIAPKDSKIKKLLASDAESMGTLSSAIRSVKMVLANDRYNPRDVSEGDVKTLTTSQVSKVCDDVIDIAENVYSFEKQWASRDRKISLIEKDIDNLVKDAENDDNDGDKAKVNRAYSSLLNSIVGLVRNDFNFQANLCSYALTTSNAFLNYGERSLAQHK